MYYSEDELRTRGRAHRHNFIYPLTHSIYCALTYHHIHLLLLSDSPSRSYIVYLFIYFYDFRVSGEQSYLSLKARFLLVVPHRPPPVTLSWLSLIHDPDPVTFQLRI